MRVTISYKPHEKALADAVRTFLFSRFSEGKLKEAKQPNAHGNLIAYFQYFPKQQ